MRSKKLFLIGLVVIATIFLLTGCSGNTKKSKVPQFVGGPTGLYAYLIEGMPPPVVFDANSYPFSVGIMLENKGEVAVGPGTNNPFVMVRLVGINPVQFGLSDESATKMLESPLQGTKLNFDGTIFPGEITSVVFEPLSYKPDIFGNTEFKIRADICYDYENMATAVICIKDDVLENVQDTSICTISGEKMVQNSGGPLHITKVTENPMGSNKIQINFQIEHVGFGEFFGREPNEKCDFSVRNTNKYYVDVEVMPFQGDSGYTITCGRLNQGSSGRIKLYQGAPTTISCTIERTRPSSGRIFQDLLNIRLKYRYGQFIETPIIIQDMPV